MSANKLYFTMIVVLGACALVAGCGDETVVPTIVPDEAPILPPQNFVSEAHNSSVVLTWDANTQGHLLGYNVYRSDGGQLDVGPLRTPAPITGTMFEDFTVIPGVGYRYRVTSVSRIHEESQHVIVDAVISGTAIEGKGKKFNF